MSLYLFLGIDHDLSRRIISRNMRGMDDLLPAPQALIQASNSKPAGDLRDAAVLGDPATALSDSGIGTVFWLVDPARNLADAMEDVLHHLRVCDCRPAKVVSVLDCTLMRAESRVLRHAEACIHFSDAVLLANREEDAQKWLRDWQVGFEKTCFPCDFQMVRKDGSIPDPRRLFFPELRRMTHVFDAADQAIDPAEATDWEATFDPEEEDDLDSLSPEADPWLARHPGGSRVQLIPDTGSWAVP